MLSYSQVEILRRLILCHVEYSQGCSKAMMGAATLNSHLFSCPSTPRESAPYADDVEDDASAPYALPDDFARTYFRAVGEHGKALWYVLHPFFFSLSDFSYHIKQGLYEDIWCVIHSRDHRPHTHYRSPSFVRVTSQITAFQQRAPCLEKHLTVDG